MKFKKVQEEAKTNGQELNHLRRIPLKLEAPPYTIQD